MNTLKIPGIIKAQNSILWDENGLEYLDLLPEVQRMDFSPHPISTTSESFQLLESKIKQLSNYPNHRLSLYNSKEEALKALGVETDILEINSQWTLEEIESILNEEKHSILLWSAIQIEGLKQSDLTLAHELKSICENRNILFVIDETHTDFGRSGRYFAHQHFAISADCILTGNTWTGGSSMVGLLVDSKVKLKFQTENQFTAQALGNLEWLEKENLIQSADELGFYLSRALNFYPKINEIRIWGLLIGIELNFPAAKIQQRLVEKHRILCGTDGKNTLCLLPNLNLKKPFLDKFLTALEEGILEIDA